MAIGFKPVPPEQQPDDRVLWTMTKGGRVVLTAVCRSTPMFDALELRFDIDGGLLHSQMYRGPALANIEPDAEAKRQESVALGWTTV